MPDICRRQYARLFMAMIKYEGAGLVGFLVTGTNTKTGK